MHREGNVLESRASFHGCGFDLIALRRVLLTHESQCLSICRHICETAKYVRPVLPGMEAAMKRPLILKDCDLSPRPACAPGFRLRPFDAGRNLFCFLRLAILSRVGADSAQRLAYLAATRFNSAFFRRPSRESNGSQPWLRSGLCCADRPGLPKQSLPLQSVRGCDGARLRRPPPPFRP